MVRKAQLTRIYEHLRKYKNKLFCGDFNFDDSKNFSDLDKRPLENAWMDSYFVEYSDLWAELYPNTQGYTFDTEMNVMITKHRKERMRYDRIMLASVNWSAKDIIIFGKDPISENKDITLSDHFGLCSTIELNNS